MPHIDLRLGDCADVLKTLPAASIQLTVTSPPYDQLRTFNGANDVWCDASWQACIQELYRVTKLRGVVVWIVSDQTIKGSESGTSFRQALFAKQCGFRLHDTMIWKKRAVHFPDSARYYNVFEYMFIWSKGRPIFNPLRDRANKTAGAHVRSVIGRRRDGTKENMISKKKASCGFYVKAQGVRFNVWEIDAGNNKSHSDALGYEHPATFPEALARDHILSWSNRGHIVLDPFMGSGTTGKMAQQLGRHFIGIELDPTYFELAKQRIKDDCRMPNKVA